MKRQSFIGRAVLLLFLATAFLQSTAQDLKSGFDEEEYLEMLRITSRQVDSVQKNSLPAPEQYTMEFRSNPGPLDNRWELWTNKSRSIMVISIRGTTQKSISWLENFYSAMVPATGSVQLNDSTVFNYKFAADPKATVHVGWTIGLGTMAPEMMQKIKAFNSEHHTKQLIVTGHSQGGALAFLLRSYLHYEKEAGHLPADLIIKSYNSAAPKPGNLYYGYDYDHITRNGWGFTIVNALDWVPETPFSIQTLRDFNNLNPFTDVEKQLKKQSFLVRLYLKRVYGRMNRKTSKSQRVFTKYLGKTIGSQIKKAMPQLKQPDYAPTVNFTRAGVPIVLQPDAEYLQKYPDSGNRIFIHHGLWPYYLLTQKIYGKNP
ncbi:lipase family protein [Pseudoflavitalea sp. G-6-1-2]|uniref:lipase family protein n=1 Tax=Pseudoflavitalea sp. G-6-1-2 TaxID=2728841 RepID=UPI001469CB65|nr:lipase family protein [Pseudoflavitalea sp. G-6-1-2]NML22462.1 lipase family protein [Pseudoflavitalea sp. G-6-1-2]